MSSSVFASVFGVLFVTLAIVLGLALYFLPSIIAQRRKHPSLGGIFALNFLLGWSLIGWIGSLVWALSNPQPVIVVQNGPTYLPQNYGAPGYPQQPVYPQQPGYPQGPVYPQQAGYPYAAPPAEVVPNAGGIAGYVAPPAADGTDVVPHAGPTQI